MGDIDHKARFHFSESFFGIPERHIVGRPSMLGDIRREHAVIIVAAPGEVRRVIRSERRAHSQRHGTNGKPHGPKGLECLAAVKLSILEPGDKFFAFCHGYPPF